MLYQESHLTWAYQRKAYLWIHFSPHNLLLTIVWMSHSRTINSKINSLHKRCLRVIYKNKTLSFEELLGKDMSVSIPTRNLQMLATKMLKVYRSMSTPITCEIFNRQEINHELCNFARFSVPYEKSVHHGAESTSNLGPKIWEIVPNETKELAIKKWKPSNHPCRLCKEYLLNIGFL